MLLEIVCDRRQGARGWALWGGVCMYLVQVKAFCRSECIETC